MSRWSREIETLDPAVEYQRIYYLLSCYEFAWDMEKALEFALFRTYAIPSISALLSWTGEFQNNTRKRYDDTELLLSEIAENGQDSERGESAIGRINEMHARFRISNNDMLYVLSTFVVEPVRWLERFGKRAMTQTEVDACVNYYRALGTNMGIDDIPQTYTAIDRFNRRYEEKNFRYAPSNAEIGSVTRDLLLSFYLPEFAVSVGRPAVHALCDRSLRDAMGFERPPGWLEWMLTNALKLRGRSMRLLPARRRPRLLTKRNRPTYPDGYRIIDLGTFD